MSPALKDGDYVITTRPRSFVPGFIYVVDHLDLGRIIKRLSRVENGRLLFKGDNPASTPEAVMAPVDRQRVKGRAVLIIGRNGLKRPLSLETVHSAA